MYRRVIILISMLFSCLFSTVNIQSYDLEKDRMIDVEIKGEVERPGIYTMKLGSTYGDLFELALLKDDCEIDQYPFDGVLYNKQLVVIESKKEEKLISINSAGLKELMTLPGIGEYTAKRIIEYRQNNGSFLKLEDLMYVKGIGTARFEKIKGYITL